MTSDFPPGFFSRFDPTDDAAFYGPERLVLHIDEDAVQAVGDLYDELGVDGTVLDLMSSWVSHFHVPPDDLVVLGMNEAELRANHAAQRYVVHDLNAVPELPFDAGTFDHVVCCVSVDYLVDPLAVFAEVAQVLRPGGLFVCTFSNRCFPTKAIRGWLAASESERVAIVRRYFALTDGFGPPTADRRTPPHGDGDPLWAVWAQAASGSVGSA